MAIKRLFAILVVLVLAVSLAGSSALVLADPPEGKGPPDGVGRPDGGGRPEPVFLTVSGTLVPYGEGLGFVYADTQFVIDFGPEWYEPNGCLTGVLGGLDSSFILQNGRYTIELTCIAGDNASCTQVAAPASGRNGASEGLLPLAQPRPGNGHFITAWGVVETKEGYKLLRAWEVKYGEGSQAWTWWRWEGQPWQKTQLLSCTPSDSGE